MISFRNLTIPAFLVFEILSAIMVSFFFWRKKREGNLKSESIFDLIFAHIALSIVLGRILYVLNNSDRFGQLSWSIYPYYYEPGAERVWFKQMPWILLKFWDRGIEPVGIMLGGIVVTLLFVRIKKLSHRFYYTVVLGLCVSQIIQAIGFFLGSDYIGKITELPIGIAYSGQGEGLRFPVQFVEALVLLVTIFLSNYLSRIKRNKGILGLYLLTFGVLQIAVELLKDKEDAISRITITQIVLTFIVFIGVLILIFSYQQKELSVKSEGEFVPSGPVSRSERESVSEARVQYSYRDFQSSSKQRVGSSESFFTRIKEKLFKKKREASRST
ncbi:prolipoprotein diacylglyceryl transferase [Candidatus Dojkabacteria bacterium]|nr:prolipoprotein diacylglyceryl transferase [Candidatus Dojkabacteria bacterium]